MYSRKSLSAFVYAAALSTSLYAQNEAVRKEHPSKAIIPVGVLFAVGYLGMGTYITKKRSENILYQSPKQKSEPTIVPLAPATTFIKKDASKIKTLDTIINS